jgi:hypothetical protein
LRPPPNPKAWHATWRSGCKKRRRVRYERVRQRLIVRASSQHPQGAERNHGSDNQHASLARKSPDSLTPCRDRAVGNMAEARLLLLERWGAGHRSASGCPLGCTAQRPKGKRNRSLRAAGYRVAEHVDDGPSEQLLPKLIIGEFGRIAWPCLRRGPRQQPHSEFCPNEKASKACPGGLPIDGRVVELGAVAQRIVGNAADLHVVAIRIGHVQAVEPAIAYILDTE